MTSHNENHDNPGIFVRLFDSNAYEVLWLDGHGVIEMATSEESFTGDRITDYLSQQNVESYARDIYSPWGEFEGVAVLRRLTLHESVHYLGRGARICAFLRPKIQAVRFIQGLEKGTNPIEHQIAAEVRIYLHRFDETETDRTTQSGIFRMLEEQLLSITTTK